MIYLKMINKKFDKYIKSKNGRKYKKVEVKNQNHKKLVYQNNQMKFSAGTKHQKLSKMNNIF